jgi:hypothetical protein
MAQVAMIVAGVLTAYSSFRGGQYARAEYDAKAAQERLRGRSQALQYKQQGINVLRQLNENLASTVARAAAGGVDPLSGSALNLQNYAMREGVRDYNQSRDNATIATGMAEYQAKQYKAAGSAAFRQGVLGALTSAATTTYKALTPTPATTTTTTTTPPPAPVT